MKKEKSKEKERHKLWKKKKKKKERSRCFLIKAPIMIKKKIRLKNGNNSIGKMSNATLHTYLSYSFHIGWRRVF
jgi:hypothetical protein